MNKVILLGRLGKDPEPHVSSTGTEFATFSVATSERYKGKDGTPQEKTEWHNIIAFGKPGEIIVAHLKKGDPILLEGRIQTRKWQDKDGSDRYSTEIMLSHFEFVGGKKAKDDTSDSRQPASASSNDVPFDDDIPF